jgi:hypothetical protein
VFFLKKIMAKFCNLAIFIFIFIKWKNHEFFWVILRDFFSHFLKLEN